MIKRLFLDIETSPNLGWFWSIGNRIRLTDDNIQKERQIICAAWKWEGEEVAHAVHWGKRQDDTRILERVIPVILRADEVVAHNGDNFDIRWLRTRAAKAGLAFPYKLPSFDTLKAVRQQFRLNSNKLDYVAKFLEVGRKTVVGFKLWKDVMANQPGALDKMVSYCKDDVIVLEDVYAAIRAFCAPVVHHGVAGGKPKYTCPNCKSTNHSPVKKNYTVAGTVRHHRECNVCGQQFLLSAKALRELNKR